MPVTVERSEQYAATVAALRGFDKSLEKNMTKRISSAAKPVIANMRNEIKGSRSEVITKDSSGAGFLSRSRGGSGSRRREEFATRNVTTNAADAVDSGKRLVNRKTYDRRRMQARSLRASIAAGVRLVNRKTGRGAGVAIRTSASRLPPDQKTLPRAFDRGKWRHPVFGNREVWVEQVVNPRGWFTTPAKKAKPRMVQEVTRALDDAAKDVARRSG